MWVQISPVPVITPVDSGIYPVETAVYRLQKGREQALMEDPTKVARSTYLHYSLIINSLTLYIHMKISFYQV